MRMLKGMLKFLPKNRRALSEQIRDANKDLADLNALNLERLQEMFWNSGEPAGEWDIKAAIKVVELKFTTLVFHQTIWDMRNYLNSEAKAEAEELGMGTRITEKRQLDAIFGPKDTEQGEQPSKKKCAKYHRQPNQ